MYSILLENENSKSVVKGVSKDLAKNEIKHKHFKKCLMNDTEK